ncbi:uncharacterized protein LOC108904024 [Anoplophora glabripennis]|uniref:uncharacterized protein LOC108904024 n=1 Tax=Anoplophora glabripennis TaxID=217634 RepID=UPI000C759B45|nr:uncharacterized protein LOC108904024 [Anoplophora glabripennis]
MSFYNINFCLKLFNLMGTHPDKRGSVLQVMIYILGAVLNLSIVILSILLLFIKERVTITDVTDSIETIGLLLHGFLKLTNLFIKRSKISNLLRTMEAHFWKIEDVTDTDARTSHQKFLNSLKNVLKFFTSLCAFLAVLFIIKGFVGQTVFEIYLPNWFPLYLSVFYQSFTCVLTISFPVISTDLFIFTIFMLTSLQFKLLNEEARNIFGKTGECGIDDEVIKARIKKCVDHHIFLKNFVKMLNDTFSQVLFIYNGDIVLSLCVEMYIVSTQNSFQTAAKAAVYVFTGMFQYTVCYCIAAQAITDEKSVYFGNWYEHPEKYIRNATTLMIAVGQRPVTIIALSFIKVNLETCLKTTQTILSYCMFLRTMGIN